VAKSKGEERKEVYFSVILVCFFEVCFLPFFPLFLASQKQAGEAKKRRPTFCETNFVS
jgi:hypothetical protein